MSGSIRVGSNAATIQEAFVGSYLGVGKNGAAHSGKFRDVLVNTPNFSAMARVLPAMLQPSPYTFSHLRYSLILVSLYYYRSHDS
jgi:hypothetical protein